MKNKSRRVTRRTTRRSKSHPRLYKDDIAGVAILVSPSATGKGIHKRWKYSAPPLNIHQTIPKSESTAHPLMSDRTFSLDGALTDMFNPPLPSTGAVLQAENHTSDRLVNDGYVRPFHDSPWSVVQRRRSRMFQVRRAMRTCPGHQNNAAVFHTT